MDVCFSLSVTDAMVALSLKMLTGEVFYTTAFCVFSFQLRLHICNKTPEFSPKPKLKTVILF
jgi:hypothetical protein